MPNIFKKFLQLFWLEPLIQRWSRIKVGKNVQFYCIEKKNLKWSIILNLNYSSLDKAAETNNTILELAYQVLSGNVVDFFKCIVFGQFLILSMKIIVSKLLI